jgi:RNA recognition motif-containing protein
MSNNEDRKQIFLGSLHYDATEEEIISAFTEMGIVIINVRIPRDQDTGRPKGYAFVDVDPRFTTLSVEEIISGIDGTPFHGRPCRADKVNAKPERNERRGEHGAERKLRERDRYGSPWKE